jgi:hypothetical protein
VTRRVGEDASGFRPSRTWLVHGFAILVAIVAYVRAPDTDNASTKDALEQFFPSAAQISATLLVAVALFGGALADPVAVRVRRWIGPLTFVYLGVATAGGTIGSVTTLSGMVDRWLFALTCGAGAAGLVTVLLMGHANIRGQRARADSAQADRLDPDEKPASVDRGPTPTPQGDTTGKRAAGGPPGDGADGLDAGAKG